MATMPPQHSAVSVQRASAPGTAAAGQSSVVVVTLKSVAAEVGVADCEAGDVVLPAEPWADPVDAEPLPSARTAVTPTTAKAAVAASASTVDLRRPPRCSSPGTVGGGT
ncbi:hypothetical protein ACWCQQ_46660, partial [Streptomyces sp. NPDC002143]